MKGQISRLTHDPEKRYAGVFLEMGRMVTDADDIERGQITGGRIDALASDAILSGVPAAGGAVDLSSGTPALREGTIYADGVRGDLRAAGGFDATDPMALYAAQADFPGAPPLAGPALVYADLFERPVFSIEDPSLVDAAFHGADTSFRTRVMAQIRLGPPGTAPGSGAFPSRGSAQLSAVLREEPEGPDPCDPCATELDLPVRTGDYLFRLEVVDVEGPADAPTRVRLLWSDENAAERFSTGAPLPEGFERDDRLYEFYSEVTEAHQGAFADPATRRRSAVLAEIPTPIPSRTDGVGATEDPVPPWPCLRRWDGGVDLDLGTGTVEPVRLGPNENAGLAGGVLTLTLARIEVTLDLGGRALLPGDYWLVEVREFAAEADRVKVVSPEPLGLVHHYLPLFEIDAAGAPQALGDAARRRLSFPALSDLPASHVGFTDNCPKLFDGAENVQQALDNLCAIAAADIAFKNNCARLYGSGRGSATTVQQALDKLCQTVQQGGGGCSFTVGEQGGEFPDIMTAIRELLGRGMRDICLCLLPGTHKGSLAFEDDDLRLEIQGCGRGNSQLLLSTEGLKLRVGSVLISGLEIAVGEAGAEIALVADDVMLRDLDVRGPSQRQAPLVTVDALDRVTIQSCDLEAIVDGAFQIVGGAVEAIGIGREEVGLEPRALLFEAREMRRRMRERAEALAAASSGERLNMRRTLFSFLDEQSDVVTATERRAIERLANGIGAQEPEGRQIVKALDELRIAGTRSHLGRALAVASARADVHLLDCRIAGLLGLYGPPAQEPLNQDQMRILRDFLSGRIAEEIRGPETRLAIVDCWVGCIELGERTVRQLREVIEIGGIAGLEVFDAIEVRNTHIMGDRNHNRFYLVAAQITLASCVLRSVQGFALNESAVYIGNFVPALGSTTIFDVTIRGREAVANRGVLFA